VRPFRRLAQEQPVPGDERTVVEKGVVLAAMAEMPPVPSRKIISRGMYVLFIHI